MARVRYDAATRIYPGTRAPAVDRLDLQIAATAAATHLPLLTMNPDDFVGIAGLVDVVPIRRAS